MAPRKPATTAEIIDVLRKGDSHHALADDRAVTLTSALDLLRAGLRTTPAKAEEWLTAAVTTPDGELILVEPRSAAVRVTREQGHWQVLTDLGWTQEEADALIIGWDGRVHEHTPGPGQYVMLRSSLAHFRAAAAAQAARRAQVRAAQAQERREQFEAVHGTDVIDTVRAFLSGLPVMDWEHPEELMDFNPHGGQQLYGVPGRLTITVHGHQIRALADLLATAVPPSVAAGQIRALAGPLAADRAARAADVGGPAARPGTEA